MSQHAADDKYSTPETRLRETIEYVAHLSGLTAPHLNRVFGATFDDLKAAYSSSWVGTVKSQPWVIFRDSKDGIATEDVTVGGGGPKGVNDLISEANAAVADAMDTAEREVVDKAVGDTLKALFDALGIETPDLTDLYEDGWLAYSAVKREAELTRAVLAPLKRLESLLRDRVNSLEGLHGPINPDMFTEAWLALAAVRREIKAYTPPRAGDTLADGTVAA